MSAVDGSIGWGSWRASSADAVLGWQVWRAPVRHAGAVPPGVNKEAAAQRIQLDDTSWVDVTRGWVTDAEDLFHHLLTTTPWQTSKLFRYEQFVEEKRLGAGWRRGQPLPHPALAEITRTIQRNYRVEFPGFGIIQYRDGNDGQGFHRDTDMRWLDDTVIAVLSLGAQRPWLLRPRANRLIDAPNKGATHDLSPASGDLLVMGGRCQADWEHSVQYLNNRRDVGVRISLQWRATRKTGEPFLGASYRADVSYRHGRAAPKD
jgi:alkylated DNA repair dioxygenase AlkB